MHNCIPVLFATATMVAGAQISGIVLDPQQKPIKDAVVRLGTETILTSADGSFAIGSSTQLSHISHHRTGNALSFRNGSLTVTLEKEQPVHVRIYSISGRLITQFEKNQSAGTHTIAIPGATNLGRGVYFLESRIGNSKRTMKFNSESGAGWSDQALAPQAVRAQRAETDVPLRISKQSLYDYWVSLPAGTDSVLGTIVMDSIGFGMKPVAAGSFVQGDQTSFGKSDELPLLTRTMSAFEMDTTEVTIGEYSRLRGYVPAALAEKHNRLPVTHISWFDAILYANERSKTAGLDTVYSYKSVLLNGGQCVSMIDPKISYAKNGYRLPTEAEWEYAAKAGGSGLWGFGADVAKIGQYAWLKESTVRPIATKSGVTGLYDMLGNAAEWTNDWYGTYSDQNTVAGPTTGTARVVRGGSYLDSAMSARSSIRSSAMPTVLDSTIGFRLVKGALNINRAPAITGQQIVQIGANKSVTITPELLKITDPDNDNDLLFTVIIAPDEQNYTVSGTTISPKPGFTGELSVTVTVKDEFGAVSEPFALVVSVGTALVDNRVNNKWRPLYPIGDSLTIIAPEAFDMTQPITVTGLGAVKNVVSADGKKVTIYPLDPLNMMPFSTNYGDPKAVPAYEISISGKTIGATEQSFTKIPVFTAPEFALIDASFRKVHDVTLPMIGSISGHKLGNYEPAYPFAHGDAITLAFNHPVDPASLGGIKYEVNHKVNGVYTWDSIAVATSLDATKKIATLVPATPLAAGQKFQVSFINLGVWADNLKSVSGAKLGGNTLEGVTLKTIATEKATLPDITGLTPVIARNANNRIDFNSGPSLIFDYTELAWNANHSDSISAYQIETTTSSLTGVKNTQIVNINDLDYSEFSSAVRKGISTSELTDLLRKNTAAGYMNASGLFAAGDSISLRIRPRLEAVSGFTADGTSIIDTTYGSWSNTIVYKDELGATDSVRLSADITGGVSIRSSSNLVDANGNPVSAYYNSNGTIANPFVSRNAVGTAMLGDTMRVQIMFREDMDISVKPNALSLLSGTTGQTTAAAFRPTAVPGGVWISSRIYEMKIAFPAMTKAAYDAGLSADKSLVVTDVPGIVSKGWGYIVNASAFKDLRGNLSTAWGSVGTAAQGSDYAWPVGGFYGNKQIATPRNQ